MSCVENQKPFEIQNSSICVLAGDVDTMIAAQFTVNNVRDVRCDIDIMKTKIPLTVIVIGCVSLLKVLPCRTTSLNRNQAQL